jgi:hypothetical protein
MALAFLPWRVNKWAALVGFAAAYLCLFTMMWWLQITYDGKTALALVWSIPDKGAGICFLLWPVIGNSVCFGVALLVDAVVRAATRPKG